MSNAHKESMLTNEHIRNLELIFNTDGQVISAKEFVDENGNPAADSDRIIAELTTMDYIENENEYTIFYLTTLGYEVLERVKQGKPEIQKDPFGTLDTVAMEVIIKFGNYKFIFSWLIALGIIYELYRWLQK